MENADDPSAQTRPNPNTAPEQTGSECTAPERVTSETISVTAPPSLREFATPIAPAIESAPLQANLVPTLGNTFLFFVVAIAATIGVGIVTIGLGRLLPPFRHQDLRSLAFDARLAIPSQAIQYLALLAVTAVIFGNIWERPFWQTLHWNHAVVVRRWLPLIAAGSILGLVSGAASNYLPMPKEAPILNDLMSSTAGAWMMFFFGTTLAPLMEEVAFRGFLLPSLINFFNGISDRNKPASHSLYATSHETHPPETLPLQPPMAELPSPASSFAEPSTHPQSLFTTAASILLASIPFALLHAQQVSGAWAPILLIGLVSIVLCIVRLWTRSLAASTLVHATYNFTLFAGMLIASDGFRHLEKLNN